MKKIFLIVMTGILLLSRCGHENEENKPSPDQPQSNNKGCIFGKITKFYSGDEAGDTQVHLLDSNKNKIGSPSKVTDFRFPNLEGGIYYIMVTKLKFDTIRPEPIRVLPNGDCQQIDWQISSLPFSLCVIEINNSIKLTPIDTLDFGTSLSLQRFKIFNNTEDVISWNIRWEDVRKSCDWISEISCAGISSKYTDVISGKIRSGVVSEPVSIYIDRDKWSKEENPALIPINGGGGWDLYITAALPTPF